MEDRVKPRIAVIGDIMQDVDVFCSTTRMAAEAPDVPVWKTERVVKRPGGAWNVAAMCKALGAAVYLIGHDGTEFGGWGLLFGKPVGKITTKTRFFIDGKMVGRNDDDLIVMPSGSQIRAMLSEMRDHKPDAIIVADHGKGVINSDVMNAVAKLKVPLFVDPIMSTPFVDGCWCGGPHELSVQTYAGASILIEKRGPVGLFYRINGCDVFMDSACENLVDQLGAGDQLIATLAYLRCRGLDWEPAIRQANVAAGLQCERAGCVPVTITQILERTLFRPVWLC